METKSTLYLQLRHAARPYGAPGLALAVALLAASPVLAGQRDPLIDAVNAYRAAPGRCGARVPAPVAPLAAHPALADLNIGAGVFLDQVLERAGYPVAQADAISVSGAGEARSVLAAMLVTHCAALLNPQFTAAGVTRTGDTWMLVLAQSAPPAPVRMLPDAHSAGPAILAAVNAARAAPRTCGKQQFDAAAPLAWNNALAQAAFSHSSDMAEQRYFSHQGKDGRQVAQRATQAGYGWRLIGENIAAGQDSAADAVASWLDSPGHCVNIMNPGFTEMGAAFAISGGERAGRVYWTQALGAPR
ncbi:CAP domain-containing protein [Massilia sp. TSP1-1-2]|uniref:CAP domain-containing protein n=1 Tax=Massilia sp. TSP1-1-2 TaxID=2804649 RepID=UPI003CF8C153